MSCRVSYILTLFLGKLSPLSGYPVLVHILLPVTDNCPRTSETKNDRRNDFMINLYESHVAELGFALAIPPSVVRRAADCAMELGVPTNCWVNTVDGLSWAGTRKLWHRSNHWPTVPPLFSAPSLQFTTQCCV